MCTLLSVDKSFFTKNSKAVIDRIYGDAMGNGDGFALLAFDPEDETLNLNISSMNHYLIIELVERFFESCSEFARIFLHSRMATTAYIGVGFNHGFTDQKGTVIMHNGVLNKGVNHLTVDSYKLTKLDWTKPREALKRLKADKETYANIFAIDTLDYSYSVLRLSVGTLHTDLEGNYSTREVGDICLEVENNSLEQHYMPVPDSKYYDLDDHYSESLYDYMEDTEYFRDYMRAQENDYIWPAKKA